MVTTINGFIWGPIPVHQGPVGSRGLNYNTDTTRMASVFHSDTVTYSLPVYLYRHPDQQFARYIYQGLTCGFRIGSECERVQLRDSLNNHVSTKASPGVVYSELIAGHMVGPLLPSWTHVLHCSPLGLVTKAQLGRFRTIVDLSSPRDNNDNDGISAEICSLYTALDGRP